MKFCDRSLVQKSCSFLQSAAAALQADVARGRAPICRGRGPVSSILRARNRDRCSIPKQGPLIHKCSVWSRNRDRFPATKQGPKRVPKRVPPLEPAICFGWHACAAIARSSAVRELVAGSALNSYVASSREHWNLQASPTDPLPGRLSKPRTPNDFM